MTDLVIAEINAAVARGGGEPFALETSRIGTLGPRTEAPFGGIKWSGIGVVSGPWGLAEYTYLHVVEAGHPT